MPMENPVQLTPPESNPGPYTRANPRKALGIVEIINNIFSSHAFTKFNVTSYIKIDQPPKAERRGKTFSLNRP
jgi:hypothetical protein